MERLYGVTFQRSAALAGSDLGKEYNFLIDIPVAFVQRVSEIPGCSLQRLRTVLF